MKKMNQKSTGGITLIALVITIIVLLILAGVSIATLTGENGILTQVSNAKGQTTESAAREEVEIAYQAALTDLHSGKISQDEVATKLGEELGVTVTKDGENYKLNYKGYSMTISKATGKVTVASTEPAKAIKWIYEENADGNIEITGMDLSDYESNYDGFYSEEILLGMDTLNIPSKIEEKQVVKLSFEETITPQGFSPKIKDVKKIIYGDSIEEMANQTSNKIFFEALEEIVWPQNLKIIGDNVFEGCTSLISINIPDGVTSIGSNAFLMCSNLSSVNIPNTVISIGNAAFWDTNGLTLNFNNGKNDNLEIPENKWGASTIMINGVATTNFTLIPSGNQIMSTESCTYEANIGENWNDWIERNKSVIQSGIAKEFFDVKSVCGTQLNGEFDGFSTEVWVSYTLTNSSGVLVKTTDIIQPEEDYTLTIN